MPRRLISTGSPFEKTAGFSRAVIDGDFAFVAGTTGYDYTTMVMPGDVTSQSRNCFKMGLTSCSRWGSMSAMSRWYWRFTLALSGASGQSMR